MELSMVFQNDVARLDGFKKQIIKKWVSPNEAVTIVLRKCSVMLEVFDILHKPFLGAAQVSF